MWVENTKSGKFKFCERYKDPVTGKLKKISVTYEKNTSQTRKRATSELEEIKNKRLEKVKSIVKLGDLRKDNITLHFALDYFLEISNVKKNTFVGYVSSANTLRKECEDILLVSENIDIIISIYNNIEKDRNRFFLKMVLKKIYIDRLTDINFSQYLVKKRDCNSEIIEVDKKLYYEKHELEEIYSKFENKNNLRDIISLNLIKFLIQTGLRAGEAFALQFKDINLDKCEFNVYKTRHAYGVTTPKTISSNRIIYFNEEVSNIITLIKKKKIEFGVYKDENDYIFCDGFNPKNPLTYFRKNLIDKGIEGRFHLFRHTHASLLFEKGISLDKVSERLGHKNDKITKDIYIHITNKMKEERKELFKNIIL